MSNVNRMMATHPSMFSDSEIKAEIERLMVVGGVGAEMQCAGLRSYMARRTAENVAHSVVPSFFN